MTQPRTRQPSVAIIGAGMSGICLAATLRRAGISDVTLYEKADTLGGTWRDNTYPGLTCDVPSRFYQFTFDPNPDWSHLFSSGAEIWAYLEGAAKRAGIFDHIRFGITVIGAEFDAGRWLVRTSDGATSAVDFLISAAGILHHPVYPTIAGLADFAGPQFHSARWDHSVEVAGKRVAIIGTGSTGVQITCGLAGVASHVDLFQRSAHWVITSPNPSYTRFGRALLRRFPALSMIGYRVYRTGLEIFAGALVSPGIRRRVLSAVCRRGLRRIKDPELRAKLTPDSEPMCRRLIVSPSFFDAVQRPDVALVTAGIDHVEADGIVTSDGVLHQADVLVLATGFDAHAFVRPVQLTGLDGRTLDETWADGPYAHLTVSLPGFPNFFMMMGPHSPVGNYSLTSIAETQSAHIVDWIERWRAGDFDAVAPKPSAASRFNSEMKAALPQTVWMTGCSSWYLGADGLPELWPWKPTEHRRRLSHVELADYDLTASTG